MFRVYIVNSRGIKLYYTGNGLVHDWSSDKSKARRFKFYEANKFVGFNPNRFIEEVIE